MRKPLTYGSASMHINRKRNPLQWRERCWEFSEKESAKFFEEDGIVYCEYLEKGKTIKVKI